LLREFETYDPTPDEKVESNPNITIMPDYEAAPEGGIREAGAGQPAAPAAAPVEEVKNDVLTPAPEAEADKTEESPDAEKSPEGDAPAADEEKTED
jgi:hypothetical protein